MIILGVDPGTTITGYGVIEFGKKNFKRLANGCIQLSSNKLLPEKLEKIYDELVKLIKIYKPDEFAIETAFYGKNVQSAMKIGYARGVSLLAAVHNKIPASEYSPGEIKKAVVGRGSASKEQVGYMVKAILNLKRVKFKSDESDALAIALCHAFRMKAPSFKKSKSWKEFIMANPERVVNL
ncbi:MAG: crossover junction endodeoxyribonuclease RuvC [Ignavibacteria bacterium]|nr:crossover junction endodeoxyribonuclease RuvC [Ignavibacteria bacterium]MBT8382413.1 crossover junction endodeoxyribonuclease RuvC [Ignavibacteria bacterium]MBT8390784.1 crossover junction endodeoxyribonuclease RuvC [Ignavibacteria bacterium]NNJ51999.1 crossover junction endodeoxyribonuclease RuvC [Ignavibacteriaceae bacterium]NNL20156.1 crossover junction endodeoxyribonuclease RuvC [Ignavibacteriaceae bacterium]